MHYPWLYEELAAKPAATRTSRRSGSGPASDRREAVRRHLQGRDREGQPAHPQAAAEGEPLPPGAVQRHPPGYYCNKEHWSSIRLEGAVPDSLVRELIETSYRLVLSGLSKKKQRELLGE